jgi:probable addiction module antidote protein
VSYASTTAQATVFTSSKEVILFFFYSVEGTKIAKIAIFLKPKYSLEHVIKMRINHMIKLTVYDPADALINEEEIAVFMADAMETGDAAYIAKAMGIVARAKGMATVAAETGLSREQLYRSFSDKGNPTLKTTLAVMKALGLDLTIKNT